MSKLEEYIHHLLTMSTPRTPMPTEKIILQQKVYIIEDEPHIAEGLAFNLRREGLEVHMAADGALALDQWEKIKPDAIVLDIMLPKIDGIQVLKQIRQKNEKIPILILTAKNNVMDKVKGFSLGVDDYLTKPFELEEFILRVKRLLKRAKWDQEAAEEKNQHGLSIVENKIKQYQFGPHFIDFELQMAKTPQGEIRLTLQELKLLEYFIERPNKVLTRQEILTAVWEHNAQLETRTLDNFIARFRKYFEKDKKDPQYFLSMRSQGYLFRP